jgi:hypothetical protein
MTLDYLFLLLFKLNFLIKSVIVYSVKIKIYIKTLRNPEFVNMAIEMTIKNREDFNTKAIYPHDLFYRRVLD